MYNFPNWLLGPENGSVLKSLFKISEVSQPKLSTQKPQDFKE